MLRYILELYTLFPCSMSNQLEENVKTEKEVEETRNETEKQDKGENHTKDDYSNNIDVDCKGLIPDVGTFFFKKWVSTPLRLMCKSARVRTWLL